MASNGVPTPIIRRDSNPSLSLELATGFEPADSSLRVRCTCLCATPALEARFRMAHAVAIIVSDRHRKMVWKHRTLVRMGRLELPASSVRGRLSAADLHTDISFSFVDMAGFEPATRLFTD